MEAGDHLGVRVRLQGQLTAMSERRHHAGILRPVVHDAAFQRDLPGIPLRDDDDWDDLLGMKVQRGGKLVAPITVGGGGDHD